MSGSSGSARGSAEERILTTAASLFAQFGYNGVSTREIASSAEVNEVTIYRHYPRKRDLYVAVLAAELQRVHLRGELLTKLAEAQTGRAALTCTFELIATTLQQQPQLLRLLQYSALELSDDLDPLLLAYRQIGHEAIGRQLEAEAATEVEYSRPCLSHVEAETRTRADDDVLEHREAWNEHEMLMHHADA